MSMVWAPSQLMDTTTENLGARWLSRSRPPTSRTVPQMISVQLKVRETKKRLTSTTKTTDKVTEGAVESGLEQGHVPGHGEAGTEGHDHDACLDEEVGVC